jgi:hypothetical protein
MSQTTQIQWCDSTVNPTMGCSGCELFPTPAKITRAINAAVSAQLHSSADEKQPQEIINENQPLIESDNV